MESPQELIRKYALINATEHGGKAVSKSVLGKLMSDHPELRDQILGLRYDTERIVEEINAWNPGKQQSELEKMGGYEPVKRVEKKGLPELEIKNRLVVRFAPNPDGALHLGNARPAVLCSEYAKKYNGKFILRFDDTDPKIKKPEAVFYKWIREDLKWLKIRWQQEVIASKRLNIYYKFAEKLIKDGKAYVCKCDTEKWKALRDKAKPCPCRDLNEKIHLREWKKMLSHKLKEKEAVLRIKTELDAKNPAARDWAAFRIVDKPEHPMSNKKLWPLYNFASAIDDHLLGITHILRGQEHATNEAKQSYIYNHFGWNYPEVVILGRFSLSGMVLSKSTIRDGIARREYSGWDDPRLGTLRSLRRRGFQPEALREIILDIGPKSSDITISTENLYAYNRKLIDKEADRYFFIPGPKRIEVKNLSIRKAEIYLHPEKKKGRRKFALGKYFYIDANDFEKYKGLEVRLKDLCNIKLNDVSVFTSEKVKALPKIQWVPSKFVPVRVNMPGKEIKGYGETNLLKAKVGDVVQFERFGFVRIEKISSKNIVVIFGHE